jgi:ATP-binding cassette subfamily F protein uup
MHAITLDRLSGGERRRLTLVRLLATAPNFLLLDEPTNDLDLDTIRQLEEYLEGFGGCILLVSHDRAMLDRLTDSLLVFDGAGGVRSFTGTYEDYRESADGAAGKGSPARTAETSREPARPARTAKAGLSFKERKEYDGLLPEIERLEAEQKALEESFQRPAADPAALDRDHRRYTALLETLQQRMNRWEELARRAEN